MTAPILTPEQAREIANRTARMVGLQVHDTLPAGTGSAHIYEGICEALSDGLIGLLENLRLPEEGSADA